MIWCGLGVRGFGCGLCVLVFEGWYNIVFRVLCFWVCGYLCLRWIFAG